MNLRAVMNEVGKAMESLTGISVAPWPAASINVPGGYVSYPTTVDYDQTYGRGTDQFTDLPVVLLLGEVTSEAARDEAGDWAAGDGPKSLKQALEAWKWETCDDVTVTQCEFDGETEAGIVYLAARFKLTVVGPGEG